MCCVLHGRALVFCSMWRAPPDELHWSYTCPANAHSVPSHGAGCGMCAVPVDGLHKDDVSMEQLLKLQSLIKRRIPTGFEQHKAALPTAQQAMEEWSNVKPPSE